MQTRHLASALAAFALGVTLVACDPKERATPVAATPDPSACEGSPCNIVMASFKYLPKAFAFNTGNNILFNLTSTDTTHTFTLKALSIDWTVEPGKRAAYTAIFPKAGTFKVVCTIPGHEGAGMTATITVR